MYGITRFFGGVFVRLLSVALLCGTVTGWALDPGQTRTYSNFGLVLQPWVDGNFDPPQTQVANITASATITVQTRLTGSSNQYYQLQISANGTQWSSTAMHSGPVSVRLNAIGSGAFVQYRNHFQNGTVSAWADGVRGGTHTIDAGKLVTTTNIAEGGMGWVGNNVPISSSKGFQIRIGYRTSGALDNVTEIYEFPVVEWGVEEVMKKVTVSLRNTKNYPVTYSYRQDGVELFQFTLQPGQAVIEQREVPSDSEVQVFAIVEDFLRDGPSWVLQEGAVTEQQVDTITPEIDPPSDAPRTPEPDTPKDKPGVVDPENPTEGNKPIWDASTDTKPNDGLTNATYKQGVDKLSDAMGDLSDSMENNKVDVSGILERLDALRDEHHDRQAELRERWDTLDERHEAEMDKRSEVEASADAQVAAAAGKLASTMTDAQGWISDAMGDRAAPPVASVTTGSSDPLTVDDPNLGGSISLNPFGNSRVAAGFLALAPFVRSVVGWGIVCGLMAYVYHELRKGLLDVLKVPTQRFTGEIVLSSGIPTSILVYPLRIGLMAALATFVATLPTMMLQLYSEDWTVAAVQYAAQVSGTGAGGALGVALSLAGEVIPIATIFSAGATYAAFEFGAINIQLVWAYLFRFFPL